MEIDWIFLALAASALLLAAYFGLGGRALFGQRERPERIVGKIVRFSAIEGLRELELPNARVISFNGSSYVVELLSPISIEAETVTTLHINARHKGYAVSSARAHGFLAIGGETPQGRGFIACLNIV